MPTTTSRELLGYAGVFGRFPWALRRFIRNPLVLEEAHRLVHDRMAQRPERLLHLLRESVFDHSNSPYLALLQRADIGFEDIETLVSREGVEATLRHLRNAGVYVTFEEFKGRRPLERGAHRLEVKASDFDNPRARRDLTMATGGSTGQANQVYQDLDHIADLAVNEMVGLDVHGMLDAPSIHWSNILPGSGIRFLLQRVRHGQYRQTWFTPIGWSDTKAWKKYAAATRYMVWWARRFGVKIEGPTVVRPDQAGVVAKAVRQALDRDGKCLLYASVSRAVRVSLAAQELGIRLDGATMRLASEPLTPVRRRQIEASGARALAGYGSIETGVIALGCGHPQAADDVHLLTDAFALIDHPYSVPGSDTEVRAFNLTGLRPSAPKVMLNYQIDDFGEVRSRTCDCGLGAMGYGLHLHDIRSYTKLVGEGATLVGNDLLRVLEEELPQRFGGTPLDYQLQEQEAPDGLTRMVLVISPTVPLDDEAEVMRFMLARLRASSAMADGAAAMWESAGAFSLTRRTPALSESGKFQPLYRSS